MMIQKNSARDQNREIRSLFDAEVLPARDEPVCERPEESYDVFTVYRLRDMARSMEWRKRFVKLGIV